ncbi:unnamed protein product [Symbiodinium sp. CCMP2592]|nr:unnamed protein product [Symbiodinium sp. CCMP2592]
MVRLRSGRRSGIEFDAATEFPMFTVKMADFLAMETLKSHEEMLKADGLSIFDETMGRAFFVSHQWLGSLHPDPHYQQLQVLQEASLPIAEEIFFGRRPGPTVADFESKPLYVWYDYLSCPQASSAQAKRQLAIEGIPSYVAKCEYFVILCPALEHADQRKMLSLQTWRERGWCRAERVARELAARNDGYTIAVESARHVKMIFDVQNAQGAPGNGEFTCEADRTKIGRMMVQMVWNKLGYYLEKEDLHNYRLLLNEQKAFFLQGLDVEPVDGLVPGFSGAMDPFQHPGDFVLARFLHQNGFHSSLERDTAGWSPICFAVVNGSSELVQGLLQSQADPNDYITKEKKSRNLPKRFSLLSLASLYHSNDVLKLLLSARANVNACDTTIATALHGACAANNAAGVRILFEAMADSSRRCFPGMTPLQVACACASADAMKELLALVPSTSLQHCLHFALMFQGGYAETITCLIQAKADVDEQFQLSMMKDTAWWLVLILAGLRHRISPSRLTLLAYHHSGATPLMFSILSGYFEATSILIAAGARLDFRNSRGQTAADLARGIRAPASLSQILESAESHPQGPLEDKSDVDQAAASLCKKTAWPFADPRRLVCMSNVDGASLSEAHPLYNNQHLLEHDWGVVTTAFLQKFPDPNLKYVKSVETVNSKICVEEQTMDIRRLFYCMYRTPKFAEKRLGSRATVVCVEEAHWDLGRRRLTVHGRNQTGQSLLRIDEVCCYTEAGDVLPSTCPTLAPNNLPFQGHREGNHNGNPKKEGPIGFRKSLKTTRKKCAGTQSLRDSPHASRWNLGGPCTHNRRQ